jgi:hypothetical protein
MQGGRFFTCTSSVLHAQLSGVPAAIERQGLAGGIADINMAALQLETDLLAQVGAGQLADSAEFAKAHNVDHQAVVGLLKSLVMADMVVMEVRRGSCSLLQCLLWANQCNNRYRTCRSASLQAIEHSRLTVTPAGQLYVGVAAPEVQVFNAVPAEGITLADLKVRWSRLCCRTSRQHDDAC